VSKTNAIWLTAIVVVGVAVTVATSIGWGLAAAGITLVVSEVAQRAARKRRQVGSGAATGSPLRSLLSRRRRR
jgi:hypothetical protein